MWKYIQYVQGWKIKKVMFFRYVWSLVLFYKVKFFPSLGSNPGYVR